MSELVTIFISLSVVLLFLCSLVLTKPISSGGKLSRKLCIVNAVGWIAILPLSSQGHPPPWLIPLIIFWLANLVLLPAAISALWVGHKDGEERHGYLAVAAAYLALNIVVLFVVPSIWVLSNARSS